MYVPASFAESDRAVLMDFIAAHPLGTLVTGSPAHGLYATHLPLHLDPSRGPHGVLQGHMARANPHHRKAVDTTDALVVFHGPDAYITPAWYPAKSRHGKVVPTWNYIAVHVQGTVRFIEDRNALLRHLHTLTDVHEAAQAHPWAVDDAPASYIEQQLAAIVGVEIEIAHIEGKWKLSQNRADDDIDGVVHGLRQSPVISHGVMASHVAARRPNRTATQTPDPA